MLPPLAIASVAPAAEPSTQVRYAPAPEWTRLLPTASATSEVGEAPLRVVYQDTQERVNGSTIDLFSAYRIKILKAEALAIGNITLVWSPSGGSATVHHVRIIRDGQAIDVLKQVRFKVLERETGLEQSVLDGNLTASLQVPGLQVGDELEFAGTISRGEPVFGNHIGDAVQLPGAGLPGFFRVRLSWPANRPIVWRGTKDLTPIVQGRSGPDRTLDIDLKDPPAAVIAEGAPARSNVRRLLEFTDYASWPELSKQYWPAFEAAARLQPNSPLRAEVAKIAAASEDPRARVEAALQLVQERVRYVFVGLDGGNYRPASADETWSRRFGDCKAKTALLIALLRELGIRSEPVLVNSKGGNGIGERLPNPIWFDHVVVRASIGGEDYWLDGTRLGDRHLDMLPSPAFEWGLPLSVAGSQLVFNPAVTSLYPQTTVVYDIDATGGFSKDALWTVTQIIHGDEAFQIKTALSALSPADAERAVRKFWREQSADIEPEQVGWRYDDRHASVVLTLKGHGKVDWESSKDGHSFNTPGGGFYAPDRMVRPSDQDQSAPWAVSYPHFTCYATTVHLPAPTPGFHWSYTSKPVNRRLAGAIYWRAAGLRGNVMRTIMSSQKYVRQLSSADAKQVNDAIPTFDNYMSSVEESRTARPNSEMLPWPDDTDWVGNPKACSPH